MRGVLLLCCCIVFYFDCYAQRTIKGLPISYGVKTGLMIPAENKGFSFSGEKASFSLGLQVESYMNDWLTSVVDFNYSKISRSHEFINTSNLESDKVDIKFTYLYSTYLHKFKKRYNQYVPYLLLGIRFDYAKMDDQHGNDSIFSEPISNILSSFGLTYGIGIDYHIDSFSLGFSLLHNKALAASQRIMSSDYSSSQGFDLYLNSYAVSVVLSYELSKAY